MDSPAHILSGDQAEAHDRIAEFLRTAGADIGGDAPLEPNAVPARESRVMAVTGKAGTGKTVLLAMLARALQDTGVHVIDGDYDGSGREGRRTLAILAPTNKAASVLRNQGIPATTIHRILYTPVYDPDYERIADWFAGNGKRPAIERLSDTALDRALAFYNVHGSTLGALAAVGIRGSDFIVDWERRDDPLDIGFVDECSMLDDEQFEDLREIFPTIVLFGDPAQLAPVGQSGRMAFDELPEDRRIQLSRIHRQTQDNPILDLAHALADPALDYPDFERMVQEAARRDDRVKMAERAESELMARSPILVWRNATRVKLIHAFRCAYGAPEAELLPGEPLVCDGIELPARHRQKRLDLEARGLVRGAQAIHLGPGRKSGFLRLHVVGTENPRVSAASIVRIESPEQEEPFIPSAARMGATFLHGAAVTIHKAQGSQWDTVQVFAPDLWVAARTGRTEAGQPLWKRLAYVGITRARERLVWVMRNRLARPSGPLTTDDLPTPVRPLKLSSRNGNGE